MVRLSCHRLALRLTLVTAIAVCAGFFNNAHAQAPTYYTVTEVIPLDPMGRHRMWPAGINSSGAVAGTTTVQNSDGIKLDHAFIWQNGVMTDLGAVAGLGVGQSMASDLNDSGEVVGTVYGNPDFETSWRAVWWHDGTYTDLHPILIGSGSFDSLGPTSSFASFALKINNAGQILGEVVAEDGRKLAYIYDHGVITVIPPANSIIGVNSSVGGLNNLGTVAGSFPVAAGSHQADAYVWQNGAWVNLGRPEGYRVAPRDINDSGQIVGYLLAPPTPHHGFLYEGGTFTDLGEVFPLSINNSGDFSGSFLTDDPNDSTHAFVNSGGQMRDLNDFVPVSFFNSYSHKINTCEFINDSGQMSCQSYDTLWIPGFGYVNAFRHLVLTPTTDTAAPQVYSYNPYTVATSAEGAVVDFGFSVADDFDRHPSLTYSTPPGSIFPIGTTTVVATARDTSGNTTVRSFQVTVEDTPPDLTLPEPIFTDATSASGAVVNYVASASDIVDGDRPVSCSPASGATFPLGETVVTCTSSDTKGREGTGTFQVFVMGAGEEPTAPGYDVPVQSSDGGLALTFYYVEQPGVTTIAPIDPAAIGDTPSGFAVSDVAYEIHTTSAGAADNGVFLAFAVPQAQGMTEEEFASLRVLHNNNGTLQDVTSGHDYASRTVYAFTNSFSPFYLGKSVGQKIETLFDRATAYKAGSTVPVRLRVRGEGGANLSSASLKVTARSLKRLGAAGAGGPVSDSGSANPDSNFRYLGEKDGGTYVFNLSTKGLEAGSYALSFYVGADRSFFYTVKFEVK